jgi:hypothetical protein
LDNYGKSLSSRILAFPLEISDQLRDHLRGGHLLSEPPTSAR